MYFSGFPITYELILCTVISSLSSMDSPPDLFPFTDLFARCLIRSSLHSAMLHGIMCYWSTRSMMVLVALGHVAKLIHVHLLFMSRLKFIFYFTFDCISLIAVAALKHSEIHFDLLFKFRMILNFSFTSGSTSILVLSWRSIFHSTYLKFHFFSLRFFISVFFYHFIFQFYLQLLHKNIRIFHWQFSAL